MRRNQLGLVFFQGYVDSTYAVIVNALGKRHVLIVSTRRIENIRGSHFFLRQRRHNIHRIPCKRILIGSFLDGFGKVGSAVA